uniref:LYR motif containing 1 n=1 Tax=Equus asinus TaxID=9793 RepID=A0A9L0ILQ9_EQUAS
SQNAVPEKQKCLGPTGKWLSVLRRPPDPGDTSQANENFQGRSSSLRPGPVADHSHRSCALTDTDLIKQCIDECTARIEIGLHYQIPYPRPIHLPPMGLIPLRGRGLRSQEKLRKLSKPVYLQSHDEVS